MIVRLAHAVAIPEGWLFILVRRPTGVMFHAWLFLAWRDQARATYGSTALGSGRISFKTNFSHRDVDYRGPRAKIRSKFTAFALQRCMRCCITRFRHEIGSAWPEPIGWPGYARYYNRVTLPSSKPPSRRPRRPRRAARGGRSKLSVAGEPNREQRGCGSGTPLQQVANNEAER